MANSRLLRRGFSIAALAACSVVLASCSGSGTKPMAANQLHARNGKTSGKEYFSESAYGVKASPRVTNKLTNLPRGGGRDQTGKPYQVRGKWYYPKEDPNYVKRGGASWYGDAFHGRLTANGEIYDMTHLTAAHPTMPLPSYARVTNTKNGSSVIVRVNDRGPYAHGRIIDLSRRAAEMLDYTHDGVATVKVEYVGRAPLDGRDDRYLMASFKPGNGAPDPSDGMPTGVRVADRGNLPGTNVTNLPDETQIIPIEPQGRVALATMGYSADGKTNLSRFSALIDTEATGWKSGGPDVEYIELGSFKSAKQVKAITMRLKPLGKIESSKSNGVISLTLKPRRGQDVDQALKAAWAAGATDAMTIRP